MKHRRVAYEDAANNAKKDNNGYDYKYHVMPEFPSAMVLLLLMLFTILAVVFAKKNSLPRHRQSSASAISTKGKDIRTFEPYAKVIRRCPRLFSNSCWFSSKTNKVFNPIV